MNLFKNVINTLSESMKINKNPAAIYSQLVFFIFISTSPQSNANEDISFGVSPSLDYVFYREFSETGDTLNTETGLLPGLQLSLNTDISNKFSVYTHVYYGASTIQYDGQLQNGQPYKTDSKMKKTHFQFGLNTSFDQHAVGVFLSRDKWNRHILSRNNVAQLSEYYAWDSLGLKHCFDADDQKIETKIAHLFNAGLDVDLTEQGYGVIHAAMPEGTAASITTSFDLNEYMPGWWMSTRLAGHYFPRGKATITQGIGITEPENVTVQLGVSLDYRFNL